MSKLLIDEVHDDGNIWSDDNHDDTHCAMCKHDVECAEDSDNDNGNDDAELDALLDEVEWVNVWDDVEGDVEVDVEVMSKIIPRLCC